MAITIIILVFSILGALDKIIGNRFGLGEEFDKAFNLLGPMALSMIGMIIIAPYIGQLLTPLSSFMTDVLHIDASILPATLLANDMGGAPLAKEMAGNDAVGMYNALVVSSMMGCTMSFTIPFALGVVKKEQHSYLISGILWGVVAIPVGCIVSGLICGLSIGVLIINLIPLIIFSGIVATGLVVMPQLSVKIFKWFGIFIMTVITIGLAFGIIRFLMGYEVVKGLEKIEEGGRVCLNAAIVLSGSFPFMYVVSKLLSKPLKVIGGKIGINEISVACFVSTLVSNAPAFGMMDKMDNKGVVMNSAFAVTGAFVVGSHLAYTMAFSGGENYIIPVIVGKMVSGVLALILSGVMYNKMNKQER